MIVVVCLNPALDITHRVPAVNWGGVNRPSAVYARPGGKGLNVARTLPALGAELLLTGFVGGITGAGIEAALGRLGGPSALTTIAGETRRTFTIAADIAADDTPADDTGTDDTARRGCWPRPATAAGRRAPKVAGNATGAGDAVAAALAHGLVLGRPWDERLRLAAALGAATVAAPVAGEFSDADYARALSAVTVHRGTARDRDTALDRNEVG
jgi:fructose-1-phosphate kinase PfkB-like protein